MSFRLPNEITEVFDDSALSNFIEAPVSVTYLGTFVYSNLIFNADEDISRDLIIDNVLMEVNQVRNIVTTPVNGRNGTVKEYISDGDYQITARGMLVNPVNSFPEKDLELFLTICKLERVVEVSSKFLQFFDINDVVITNYRVSEKLGTRNEVPFELTMVSDQEITLDA